DHLIGATLHRLRHDDAELPGGLQIDNQLEWNLCCAPKTHIPYPFDYRPVRATSRRHVNARLSRITAARERPVTVCWKPALFLKTADRFPGRGRSRQQPIVQRQPVR